MFFGKTDVLCNYQYGSEESPFEDILHAGNFSAGVVKKLSGEFLLPGEMW
jgi:hypothetical protein